MSPRAKKATQPGRKPLGLTPKLLRLDEPALLGLGRLCADYGPDGASAVRMLLTVYGRSPAVRKAVAEQVAAST